MMWRQNSGDAITRSWRGAKNIKQRLRLIYGGDCDFEIDGSLGQGAAFTVTPPFAKQEK